MSETPIFLRSSTEGVLLDVHIVPGAKRSSIVGMHGDRLKIALKAPPVDGKANKALCTLLASHCQLSTSTLRIVRGAQSRRKTICFDDCILSEILPYLKDYSA